MPNSLIVAPMAGVTDRPFRQLCKRLGAGYAVSEMVAANPKLWGTEKTMRRGNHQGEVAPIAVQIAGAEPLMLADAARYNVERGAQIIDINMGCPAKKVCNVMAGSALLQNETLVAHILQAVVNAVKVPVTLKFRTGWNRANKNAVAIARIAQDSGIQMLSIHGRTRADGYKGEAEYDTIAQIKASVRIPVVANGDIDSPQKAQAVLRQTGADGLMIGRAAQGSPWIFREILHYFSQGSACPAPSLHELRTWMHAHLQDHYDFYGEYLGVRTARKHIGWYVKNLPQASWFCARMNVIEDAQAQWHSVDEYLNQLEAEGVRSIPLAHTQQEERLVA